LPAKRIFVFGSNLRGLHGAGAARFALDNRGAILRQAVGLQGESYAIPTKDYSIEPLALPLIAIYVKGFLRYAKRHPEMTFEVTRIGCGLAGYTDKDISPMFAGAPINCELPDGWRSEIGG
jgi:hypothetical protein